MHEWSLAEAVVAAAAKIARDDAITAVREVVIGLGELQGVDREAFEFGLGLTQAGEASLAGARFLFETVPARLVCRPCGHAWTLQASLAALPREDREAIHMLPELAHVYVACPACSSPDFEIVGGRGVTLLAVNG